MVPLGGDQNCRYIAKGPRDETIMHMAVIQRGHSIFEKDSIVSGHHIQ